MYLEFKQYKQDYSFLEEPTNEEVGKQLEEEPEMGAEEITDILEKYLKDCGLVTAKERNYGSHYTASCPFDLAAGHIESASLYGFEVKSDKDSFVRLGKQLDNYRYVCDGVWLVLHKFDPPKWLPEWCGILRVLKDGRVFQEKFTTARTDQWLISSGFEWDLMLEENGLGKLQGRIKEVFGELEEIRSKVLFNRFFSEKCGKKIYLSEAQKLLIVGFDVPSHIEKLKSDIKQLEKRFNIIKSAVNLQEDK